MVPRGTTTSPQFGIGGAIGGYPGVYTPTPTAPPAGIGIGSDCTVGLIRCFGSGAATAENLVAGPGQAPPVAVNGAGLSNAIGQAGYANTILNGDASFKRQDRRSLGMINPILAAPFAINSALDAILGGADSADRRAIRRRMGGCQSGVSTAPWADRMTLSPGWWNQYSNHFRDNTPDLNFLNSFLDSKTFAGDQIRRAISVGAFPGYLNGGSVEARMGTNIDQLWADLANYYTSYDNAPQMVCSDWGRFCETTPMTSISKTSASPQRLRYANERRNPGVRLPAMFVFNSFGGDPAQNPDHNWLVTPSSAYLYGVLATG